MNTWDRERLDAVIGKLVNDSSSERAKTIAADLRAQWEALPDTEIARVLAALEGLRADEVAVRTLSAFYTANADYQQELSERAEGAAFVRFSPALQVGGGSAPGRKLADPLSVKVNVSWDCKREKVREKEAREQRRAERLRAAIEQLSPHKREVIELADELPHIAGRPNIAEVARVVNRPYDTVLAQHRSAKKDIRRFMARDGQKHTDNDTPTNSILAQTEQSGGYELILRPLRPSARTPAARCFNDDHRNDYEAADPRGEAEPDLGYQPAPPENRIPGVIASQMGGPDEMSIGRGNWNRREWSDNRRREVKQNMALAALKRQAEQQAKEDAAEALRVTLGDLLSPEQLALLRAAVASK